MSEQSQAELSRRKQQASIKERALLVLYFGLARIIPDWFIRRMVQRMGQKRPEDIGVTRINERIARDLPPRPKGRVIWLHSIGPGDSTALLPLIPQLLDQDPTLTCIVTTRTFAAQKTFAKLAEGGRVQTYLAPYDTIPIMRRFLDHWSADLAIFCERDIWPVALSFLKQRNIATAIVNGQMDGRLGNDLRKMPGLGRWMMGHIDLIHVFSDSCATDARNWMRDDAQIVTCPNLKLDAAPLTIKPDVAADLRTAWRDAPMITAASVRTTEIPVLLDAFELAQNNVPDLKFILAPRWKEQSAEIHAILQQRGYPAPRRSIEGMPDHQSPLFIADSYGELGTWFSTSAGVFMGDTLFNGWGHNPYEPVLMGRKVIAGSYSRLFGADFSYLEHLGLCGIAPDATQIAREIVALSQADAEAPGFSKLNAARGFARTLAKRMMALPSG